MLILKTVCVSIVNLSNTENKMPDQAVLQGIVFLAATLTTLALPVASTDASLRMWGRITGLGGRLRERRRARLSRELDDRLKKYWVIDMRDLR